MMKKILLAGIMAGWCTSTGAQQGNLPITTSDSTGIELNNYSTSYLGDVSDKEPFLVTAIPYHGVYDHGGGSRNSPLDLSFSDFRFRSQLGDSSRVYYTYDSGEVYFFTPGIFHDNASRYEFRVLENGKKVLHPWGPVTTFVDASFQLDMFRSKFGLLGGFSTGFGNFLVVELRRKGADKAYTASIVHWQATRPAIAAVLTTGDLTARMLSVTNDYRVDPELSRQLETQFGAASNAAGKSVPDRWEVASGQQALIFQVAGQVYKKAVVEYRVLQNGRVLTDWTGNKANNSYVWIDQPEPGDYVLELRFRKQRAGITTYPFTVRPAWYQTWAFKITAGILAAATIGFLILAFKLRRQRRATQAEQAKKERLELGLKSVYAQLNPHFTFNALSSIQGLINSHDIKGANHYLAAFAQLVRRSLADSERKFIPLQQELDTLDIYLGLEKLRFNFAYEIQVEPGFPVAAAEIPSLLLQPLVENAIKHGVAVLQDKGRVGVSVRAQLADMLIRITDNGAGFDAATVGGGYGLQLTRDRIRLFNEMAGHEQITLRIDSAPASGTTIELLFKNWLA